jgi:hypothetical protein
VATDPLSVHDTRHLQPVQAGEYGASTANRRRTNRELDHLDGLILEAIMEDAPVTLRGVFYRVEAIGGVEKNHNAYRLIGRQLLKLRRAESVPYDAITDGSRYVVRPKTYPGLRGMLAEVQRTYRRQLWADQVVEVHVFTEKDAISGVVSPVTEEFDVPLAVVRGYCSESFAYSLAEAVADAEKPVVIYQLGDHDPSGLDAWRDLQAKVRRFAPKANVTFERIAVTPAQIEEYRLPTRPNVKHARDYRSHTFDGRCVEVDAIPARELRAILRAKIESHIDQRRLRNLRVIEAGERADIGTMIGWFAG